MKLLSIDETYRRWLNSRSALAFDNDLNEILVGLTHSESIFFAELSSPPGLVFDAIGADGINRFLDLHERHELTLAFRSERLRFLARP